MIYVPVVFSTTTSKVPSVVVVGMREPPTYDQQAGSVLSAWLGGFVVPRLEIQTGGTVNSSSLLPCDFHLNDGHFLAGDREGTQHNPCAPDHPAIINTASGTENLGDLRALLMGWGWGVRVGVGGCQLFQSEGDGH